MGDGFFSLKDAAGMVSTWFCKNLPEIRYQIWKRSFWFVHLLIKILKLPAWSSPSRHLVPKWCRIDVNMTSKWRHINVDVTSSRRTMVNRMSFLRLARWFTFCSACEKIWVKRDHTETGPWFKVGWRFLPPRRYISFFLKEASLC